MPKEREAEYKPLLFTTTIRTPERIVGFLNALLPFENVHLTNDIVLNVIKKLIAERLYTPQYVKHTPRLKAILQDEAQIFSDKELDEIIENSPQNHKEAGFDKGWSSRFDTMFKFAMELGFVFYSMNKPIIISNTGYMLIDAYNEETSSGEKASNGDKIQNVFLNAMMKYQTNNPFRKIKNENAPLVLLLKAIKILNDESDNKVGIAKRELPLLICWTDNNACELANQIKQLRNKYGFEYSDEIIYDICLQKLGASDKDKKRFKLDKICSESVDEFIRKIRITGVISLRGMGRFIDFNTFEIDKINYILHNYSEYQKFDTREAYFAYIGIIDNKILSIPQVSKGSISEIRKDALAKWANIFDKDIVLSELIKLRDKKECRDEILREISAPTRFEFLTAIALKQHFHNLEVLPNYKIDDEGLPTFTASGGMADIECYDKNTTSLFEVTLLRDRSQSINEIPAITRHLQEATAKFADKIVFAVFIAPTIHQDTEYMIKFSKSQYGVDILPMPIPEFIEEVQLKEYKRIFCLELKQKSSKIFCLLKQRYPEPETLLTASSPWQLLVATVLAAQCTDKRVNQVTPLFFSKWPWPKDLAVAQSQDVEEVIYSTGFYRNKAKNLMNTAKILQEKYQGAVPATMEELLQLPGLARKTANIVLNGGFGLNVGIAVDTHVKRISFRLGLTKASDPNKIEQDLMKLFPSEHYGEVNHLLVWFGRDVCKAIKPKCGDCELFKLCLQQGLESGGK